MLGLLVKDICLMRQRAQFFIVMAIMGVVLGFNTESYFTVAYVTLTFSMFAVSTISYDEYDNCYSFLMTLPTTCKIYVYEKYLLGAGLGLLSWLFSFAVTLLAGVYRGLPITNAEDIFGMLIFIPVFMTVIAVSIPVQLKYGGEKSRTVLLLFGGGVFMIGVFVLKLSDKLGLTIPAWVQKLGQLEAGQVFAGMFVLMLLFVAISMIISIRIMQKKEF